MPPYFYADDYGYPVSSAPEFPRPLLIAVSSPGIAAAIKSGMSSSEDVVVVGVGEPILKAPEYFATVVILVNEHNVEDWRWYHSTVKPSLRADCKQVWPR